MRYYKFLTDQNTGGHYDYRWPLPKDGKPGDWTPEVEGPLVICNNGYHVLDGEHLYKHLQSNLYEVEIDIHNHKRGQDKIVTGRARLLRKLEGWNRLAMYNFVLDCAIKVLPIFETQFPDDLRPREVIESSNRLLLARRDGTIRVAEAAWVDGESARSAAWAAVRAAAWKADVSRSAGKTYVASRVWAYGLSFTPSAASLVPDVLWAAADTAAWAGAKAAAYAATLVASKTHFVSGAVDAAAEAAVTREWQSARVLEYANGTARPLALPERKDADSGQ